MIKNVIFDWAGVINDSFEPYCELVAIVAKRLGREAPTPEEIRSTFTIPYMKFWNHHFPDLKQEDQEKMYDELIHKVDDAKIYPGAKEILLLLHEKGIRLFVLSSDTHSKLIPEAKEYGIYHIFEEILTDVHHKDEEMTKLLKKHNLDPKETLYIGDTAGDVEAGKHNNVKTIGISWGFQDREGIAKANPDFLIDDIKEMEEIMNSLL